MEGRSAVWVSVVVNRNCDALPVYGIVSTIETKNPKPRKLYIGAKFNIITCIFAIVQKTGINSVKVLSAACASV
ncbi:hypothetical protein [Jannaschia sp. W003]|uniref:hypothetical protein n=1 Tax=Jannaschia sp. W003 TaxID=2867012 RepID=UPI0021A89919|nr:hypothetical protein [Jannaschia sp. W003]UWQ21630.1 hypothetical protein K3554_00960 [Jannaschia sp. W003]